jgi:hypothetical protein
MSISSGQRQPEMINLELHHMSMNGRTRLQETLSHRQPDRVVMDFGASPVTGMHVSCVAALRQHYGLERRPVKVHEPYQMLGLLEEDLLTAMGVDVVGVAPYKTMFGFANDQWKEWSFHGLDVLVSEQFRITGDPNGEILIYPEGDLTAPPSGRMPTGSAFFDAIVRQPPLNDEQMNPEDNLEEFGPIGETELDHFSSSVRAAAATGRGVVANFGGTAFGDIALVPAPFLKHPRGIRDVTEWYISTRSRRDYIHQVFDAQCEVALRNLAAIHGRVGNAVDAVFVCGTDFGTQTSAFCSVPSFRELWFPYYQRVNHWIHSNTTWKTFKHSCGSVARFFESFIEAGFDIVNPVQCSAAGMDPAQLKRDYGSRLVFWGGGVDTQKTLPFLTPAEVREEVLRRCEIFAPGGGFVFNSIHNVQAGTPTQNIVAMIDAVHEFNGLPHGH